MSKAGKPRFSLIPSDALALVIEVLEFGARKHKAFGWIEHDSMMYFDACHRHLAAWQSGEALDESGLPHLAHGAANLLFALALELRGNDGRHKT